ncbi:response regulator [Marinomonas balearica]|uniref:Sensory/regulatory protein RpfC n=1 Tax=Marinomonas balearica TaxID=491947 RepID=A0A4R6ML77_9GAMM|nr:response regulator [Marinomonas balearica]TDP01060.1 signal transduction histidine kinase [Marinomonas balearica]
MVTLGLLRNWRLWLFGLASLLFLVFSIGLYTLINDQQKMLASPAEENALRAVHQTEKELLRFQFFLNETVNLNQHREDLAFRFDLVYSRVAIMQTGKLGRFYRSNDDLQKHVESLKRQVDIMDDLVQAESYSSDFVSLIMPELEKALDEALDIELKGLLYEANESYTAKLYLVTLFNYFTYLLGGLALSVLALIVELVLQSKRSDEKHLQAIRLTKELEENFVKAQAATKAKTEFLATMSHEIRTPMNGIIGLGHLIQSTVLDQTQTEYVRKMLRSADSLLSIINDILDFSKIESGAIEIERRDFNLDSLLEQVFVLNEWRAIEKGLMFIIDRDFRLDNQLIGDAFRMNQILVNLVSNAIKFTDSGKVTLTVSQIERNSTAWIRFSVVDTGLGIRPNKIESLFEAFKQEDSSTTRRFGGTGLGLAITKQLSDLLGGEIHVKTEFGSGSEFRLECPLIHAEPEEEGDTVSPQGTVAVIGGRPGFNQLLTQLGWEFEFFDVSNSHFYLQRTLPNKLVLLPYSFKELKGWLEQLNQQPESIKRLPRVVIYPNCAKALQRVNMLGTHCLGGLITPTAVKEYLATRTLKNALVRSNAAGIISKKQYFKDKHILIVEDNALNAQILGQLLTMQSASIGFSPNGEEAVNELKLNSYDLIIMDVQMPILDGYSATRQIRLNPKLKDIPIIAMTANAMKGDREKALESGMNDYLSKPVVPETLYSTLIKWLGLEEIDVEPISYIEPSKDKTLLTDNDASPVIHSHPSIQWPEYLLGLNISQGVKQCGSSKDVYRTMLRQYLKDLDSPFQSIRLDIIVEPSLEASTELKQLAFIAHRLKGSSESVAALEIAAITAALEIAAKTEHPSECAMLLSQFDEARSVVIASIQTLL